jgi:hypothetical protein
VTAYALSGAVARGAGPGALSGAFAGGMTAHALITLYGAAAVTLMMISYALEHRHPAFVLAFAICCLAASGYGFLAGAWPFGVVEAVWAAVAVRRYLRARNGR